MMAGTNFLGQLVSFPKDSINDETIELIKPYLDMEDYTLETATRVCGNVAGLLSWTVAMSDFFAINKEVLPLKVKLDLYLQHFVGKPGDCCPSSACSFTLSKKTISQN